MKSQTILFKKKDLGHIRVIGGNKNPLFCLRDVCDILGVKNYKDVVKLITDEFGDDVGFSYTIADKQGKIHKVSFIPEPQLYLILIRSDSPKAYLLRQWVKLEIAPQIKQQKEIQMIDTKEKTRNNTFTFNGLPITIIDKEGEPWFIAKEVCKVLGISNPSKAVDGLDEDELTKSYTIDRLGRKQEVLTISESGLYTLIMRSNKPQAKAFRKWVINEVLVQLPSGHKENNKQLQVFNFNNTKLDYAVLNNEPLFNLNNIANILNISNPRTSIDANDNDYVIKLDSSVVGLTYNRNLNNRGELFLTEAGLYKLIMTSKKKEAEAFQKWVVKEVLPSIRKTGSYQLNGSTMSDEERLLKLKELDIRSKEADAELQRLSLIKLEHYNKLAERYKDMNNGTYSQILDSYATKELTGEHILPLPELPEKYYSAGEVGKLLGISANKVGRLANTHKLKNEQYGKWFADKSPYSTKEVQTFKYNNNFISFIRDRI